MIFLVAVLVFVLDRLTKNIAIENLIQDQSMQVLPNIFHLTLVLNNGTAFGLFKGGAAFFAVMSVFIIAAILIYLGRRKNNDPVVSLAAGLMLGAAAGNLVDRVSLGYVIDFLDFRVWPVFNVADSAITISIIMLAIRLFFVKRNSRQ